MFVLGVDPGVSRCGYGCVEAHGGESRATAMGVLRTPAELALPARLAMLLGELRRLFDELRPHAVAVEQVFFQVNVRTAMSVAQASGLVLAAAAEAGCEVAQYGPNQVKQAVAGYGGAPKDQVQRMVQTLLRLPGHPRPPDVADALALALCHLAVSPLSRRVEAASSAGATSADEVLRGER